MIIFDFFYLLIFIAALIGLAIPLSLYITKVYQGKQFCKRLETLSYKICKVQPKYEMNAWQYAKALLLFHALGALVLFMTLLLPFDLNFNTTLSFVTNTNWQAYAGERLSYLDQMAGLTPQNFLSAASGIAVLFVLMRGLTRQTTTLLGNFWQDIIRILLYILLPLSIILAIFYLSQGVIQTFDPAQTAFTLEGAEEIIPLGPVASQEAIKILGSNGGGFFGANSAHPFENPTPLSNFVSLIGMTLIPLALIITYGEIVGLKQHGIWLVLTFFTLFLLGLSIALWSETTTLPSMEGKEERFGTFTTILWTTLTTITGNGSVNGDIASLTPLASGVALFNIMLSDAIFGGVGTALCSMIMFILLTLFLSGLMIGRSPEYLGKKIEKREIQWVALTILVPSFLILIGASLTTLFIHSPHKLTAILYAFASTAGNNGSNMSNLESGTVPFNIVLGCVMVFGRFSILLPSIFIAGLFAKKKRAPIPCMFSTNTLLFYLLFVGTILLIGSLTFFPALMLGPVIDHLSMMSGHVY